VSLDRPSLPVLFDLQLGGAEGGRAGTGIAFAGKGHGAADDLFATGGAVGFDLVSGEGELHFDGMDAFPGAEGGPGEAVVPGAVEGAAGAETVDLDALARRGAGDIARALRLGGGAALGLAVGPRMGLGRGRVGVRRGDFTVKPLQTKEPAPREIAEACERVAVSKGVSELGTDGSVSAICGGKGVGGACGGTEGVAVGDGSIRPDRVV
jgi:hypothetical protein